MINKFAFSEDLKDLIETNPLYEVVEHDDNDGSMMVKVGKKIFVIQIKEL